MKKTTFIYVLAGFLLFVACNPSKRSKEYEIALGRAKQDSINAIVESQKQAAKDEQQRIQDSIRVAKEYAIKTKEEANPVLTSDISYFDYEFESSTRIYYDKDQVKWSSNDENVFRFVYQKDLKKLIVYKNNKKFRTFQNPLFTTDKSKIYVNGLIIFKLELDENSPIQGKKGVFAPKGLNSLSEYYILHTPYPKEINSNKIPTSVVAK